MFLPAQPANLVDQLAPSGVWTVRLQNVLLKPEQTANAWIERDDLVYGYPRGGRQSYFDEPCTIATTARARRSTTTRSHQSATKCVPE